VTEPKFKQAPACEICIRQTALSFSFFEPCSEVPDGGWRFACMCTAEIETAYVPLSDFFKTPSATVDWLAHLGEKTWFDADDWFAMMRRFREATDSFNRL
jgi:hypothetical protein